jgi:hypothetical protein
MNAPDPKNEPQLQPRPAGAPGATEEDLEGGWFVQPASQMSPVAKARSVPPTGDDEVDGWLR